MSNQYYRESLPYRSPLRDPSPPTFSQRRYYSPPRHPSLQRDYSPPRNPRQRTPPRNFSSPNDTVNPPFVPFFYSAMTRESW
jgi:hypothetical protein